MTIPTLDPSLDPDHDCSVYDPRCVDACADPCECGCNEEPESRYGILVEDRDGVQRAATGREAAHWARAIVRVGIIPRDHPTVRHIRALRRRDHLVTAGWITCSTVLAAGAAAELYAAWLVLTR